MSPTPAASQLHFLPWVRSGAAGVLGQADPLTGTLPAAGSLRPWLRIAGHDEIDQEVRLHGPGHVTGLDAGVVVRRVPADGTVDAEPPYLAAIELVPADLPWRYTPAGPGRRSAVRPWLVLVVVRVQEGVECGPEVGAPLPVLRIEAPAVPAAELPDLDDSSAWAHVQSSVPAADLPSALAADPLVAVARLLCPRRLLPDESWLACVVPAFAVGRDVGLGPADPSASETGPAWTGEEDAVRLPVYHSWTFRTGPDGDFESLARRIEPDLGASVLGRIDLDLGDPGPPLTGRPPGRRGLRDLGDLVGGLRSAGVRRRPLPAEVADWYAGGLASLLDHDAQRPVLEPVPADGYHPERDDPVVAPPLYGAFQTGSEGVPGEGGAEGGVEGGADGRDLSWQRRLNLDPQVRAVAGLGAEVIRRNAEALLASAWAQAGAVAETEQALDHALLAVEVNRSWARRVSGQDDGAVVQLTARLHAWVPAPVPVPDGGAARAARTAGGEQWTLARSLDRAWPGRGLIGPAAMRALRPTTALVRGWVETVEPQLLEPLPREPQPPQQLRAQPLEPQPLEPQPLEPQPLEPASDPAPPITAVTATFLAATSPRAPAATAAVLAFAAPTLAAGAWTSDPALGTDSSRLEPSLTAAGLAAGPRGATVASSFTGVVLARTAPAGGSGSSGSGSGGSGRSGGSGSGSGSGAGGSGRAGRSGRPGRPERARQRPADSVARAVAIEAFDGRAITAVGAARDLAAAVAARGSVLPAVQPAAVADLSAARDAVVGALDPMPAVRDHLLARVPGLRSLVPRDGLPTGVTLTPRFTDPVSADVVRWDPRLLVPGIETLPQDRAALLAADDEYVAAVLAGANHELSREFLWREFPTDPSATFLHRFWDTGPAGPDDIPDIAGWTGPGLAAQVSGVTSTELSVFVLRGELLRRYPDARVYAVRAVWVDGGPEVATGAEIVEVVLFGRLDVRTRFYGLPRSLRTLRGDRARGVGDPEAAGWFVAIEEAATGPRFGFDDAADDGSDLRAPAASWEDLTWGHLVPSGGTLADVPFAVARAPLRQGQRIGDDPRVWGRNAAHLAAISYQRPFRALLHADQLLADPAARRGGGSPTRR